MVSSEVAPHVYVPQVLQAMQKQPLKWVLTCAGNLITQNRECETLSRVGQLQLQDAVLQPDQHLARTRGAMAQLWPADATGENYRGYIRYLQVYEISDMCRPWG